MAEEVEKYERKQGMQAEARATGDQGLLDGGVWGLPGPVHEGCIRGPEQGGSSPHQVPG